MVGTIFTDMGFYLQRLTWISAVDLILVTVIIFVILRLLRGTQAFGMLRGIVVLIILTAVLASLLPLPGFSWLLRTALPALLVAVPVIFAPEIRRALDRLGRAGSMFTLSAAPSDLERSLEAITSGAQRLSDRSIGGLIVIERETRLDEYLETGVPVDALLSPELLLQLFHVNTPLHDGAVIIRGERVAAAACVMPLSASGTLARSRDRQMGLRHRAALGISEVSDAVAIVVSEETGAISVAHNGRMIRRLDSTRLRNILMAFYHPRASRPWPAWVQRLFGRPGRGRAEAPGES
ncbi:MAG TPA: diadenylate cyclase CdaA [Anaerolineales bacterium]|nr:diadenylate cyclase CdaA [Anaerolineales bacterium]